MSRRDAFGRCTESEAHYHDRGTARRVTDGSTIISSMDDICQSFVNVLVDQDVPLREWPTRLFLMWLLSATSIMYYGPKMWDERMMPEGMVPPLEYPRERDDGDDRG